ncbi:hypothetical protein KKB18_09165 [bacterium]|nr:hypothetical protein [bacterium]
MKKDKEYPDFSKLEERSIRKRKSLVHVKDFAKPLEAGIKIGDLWDSIPDILAGSSLKEAVQAVVSAFGNKKPVILAFGAHLIKVGLSPLVIDLIQKKVITGIAINGACIIHDFEIAYHGATSEDVEKEIAHGTFGLTEETSSYINNAIIQGQKKGEGIGSSISRMIGESDFPYKQNSILAACWKFKIPATVHIAIGTDITHISSKADGGAIGEGSFRDFKKFIAMISELDGGGVFINIGSAVIIPEVFLKAVSAIRNLGNRFENVTTIVFDFINQYRARQNIVQRPLKGTGKGMYIIGHHELMIPLFFAFIKEEIFRSQ